MQSALCLWVSAVHRGPGKPASKPQSRSPSAARFGALPLPPGVQTLASALGMGRGRRLARGRMGRTKAEIDAETPATGEHCCDASRVGRDTGETGRRCARERGIMRGNGEAGGGAESRPRARSRVPVFTVGCRRLWIGAGTLCTGACARLGARRRSWALKLRLWRGMGEFYCSVCAGHAHGAMWRRDAACCLFRRRGGGRGEGAGSSARVCYEAARQPCVCGEERGRER